MSFKERFVLVALTIALAMVYLPINRLMSGGVMLKTPFDPFPVWAVWVVPYMLWEPFCLFCALWAAWKMEAQMFRQLMAAMIFSMISGFTCFVIFPTYVERPPLFGHDLFTEMLRWLYGFDNVYNAFPSGHIYILTVLAFYYVRWYPWQRWWWVIFIILIVFSTLFTVQHYLPDIFGGLVLAWVSYHFGLRWVNFHPLQTWRAKHHTV